MGVRYDAGTMVLLRGAGRPASAVRARAGSVEHLHAHWHMALQVALTLRPAILAPTTRRLADRRAVAREPARALPSGDRELPARAFASVGMLAARVPSPAFVPRSAVAQPRPVPAAAAMTLLSPVRAGTSAAAARAGEIAGRVRRNAMRNEQPVAMPAAVLATPHRPAPGALAGDPAPEARPPFAHDGFGQSGRPQPAAALDVEALTGMVIQQIDRRLVAYRERMGRG
jgi:hypothetical protein